MGKLARGVCFRSWDGIGKRTEGIWFNPKMMIDDFMWICFLARDVGIWKIGVQIDKKNWMNNLVYRAAWIIYRKSDF